MVELSKQFGWTPDQIREMSVDDLQTYRAVLSGWKKRGVVEEV